MSRRARAAARALTVAGQGDGLYIVTGGAHAHQMRPAESFCDCEAHKFRPDQPCKHLQAVWAFDLRAPRPQRPGAPVPVGP